MKQLTIKLDQIDKVKRFVNIVSRYDGDLDLVSNRFIVDAKSIMGIFSLDLSAPLVLNVYSDGEFKAIAGELADFVV